MIDFILTLFKSISCENTVLCVPSISGILLSLVSGIDTEPKKELNKFIKNIVSYTVSNEITLENKIYLPDNINICNNFEKEIQTYGTDIVKINFTNSNLIGDKINNWLPSMNFKHGLINKILSHSNIIALSLISFKGEFLYTFDVVSDKFITNERTIKIINMMYRRDYFKIKKQENVIIVEIPLKDFYNLVIIMPSDFNFNKIEAELTNKNILSWCDDMEMEEIKLLFPMFAFGRSYNLNSILIKMGITKLFTCFNLPNISNNVTYPTIVHKCFIDLSYDNIANNYYYDDKNIPLIKINKPFIFFIRENENIFYIGRVTNL
ncbi:Serpin 2/CrmA [Eptesipox virus]|uniref:Serpin 2 n=1 Tax=Eptesipox virus TaxID=1329402 RepID=A0A220T6P5_9POXV|nr:serpin 2 [Eptesipox virus]YP_009408141.1 Serpin 2/CrmA [Eptesipox virus]ASK51203.1 serpin 2 [Eptesipox virus]ASK51391.1 Serpin 2/CrmA [Eptesipox virus]WAH70961.1 serpin 2 [Eptesipox virus]WAH71149.1 serpin 2/CrmA [Eptesipox virus]